MSHLAPILVTSTFDKILAKDVFFLEQAAKLGSVQALLFSDQLYQQLLGHKPLYPQLERKYLLKGISCVEQVNVINSLDELTKLSQTQSRTCYTPSHIDQSIHKLQDHLDNKGLKLEIIDSDKPIIEYNAQLTSKSSDKKKVIVTGCYDWFHSGHLRFFEVASRYGDLYVSVGNDKVLTELKGEGHPLFPQEERWYMIQSVKFVHTAFISSGSGWLDAAPEIEIIQPDVFIVNEDGDREQKRQFCKEKKIDYVVLKREPKRGLPKRTSTNLRGF
ncbi:MAG TPA: hypothetical protein DCP10_04520 [Bacteroidales bacterium]|nr:hypothetical protein [Bacteroidales bacterium]